jgi:very-short-patch-repair endonuclease
VDGGRVVHRQQRRGGGPAGRAGNLCAVFEEIVAAQQGVVSRAQALACGLTAETIRARLDSGRWRVVLAGVYATFSGPLPRLAVLWAGLLHAGPSALLSHDSAAELVGLAPQPGPLVHVTVPASRRCRAVPGVVVHRCRRAEAMRHPTRTPPQTRVEETVLDLADSATDPDEAIGWLTRACARRLTTATRLTQALRSRTRLRWRAELTDALTDVAAGCHSLLELRYLRDVERRHHLPAGTRQRPRKRRGGCWYDDVAYTQFRTLVELDGRAAHPPEQRWRDMARDNAGVADGNSVLRYGATDVYQHPCAVASQVATVLQHNGWPDDPTPCSDICPLRCQ